MSLHPTTQLRGDVGMAPYQSLRSSTLIVSAYVVL